MTRAPDRGEVVDALAAGASLDECARLLGIAPSELDRAIARNHLERQTTDSGVVVITTKREIDE